jgi:hypothetical protein
MRAIQVHRSAATGEAYDASQCDDAIRDGDVLSVPSEGVVGVLVGAWPVAITAQRGCFHRHADGLAWDGRMPDRDYRASVNAARQVIA